MRTIINPGRKDWPQLLQRPVIDQTVLFDKVKIILQDVKMNGDEAIKKYTLQFDKVKIDELQVSEEEIKNAIQSTPALLKKAIGTAAANIRRFHEKQLQQPEI